MANQEEIALMGHLLRRAGFGAGRAEIESQATHGYNAVVEELLNPNAQPRHRRRHHGCVTIQPTTSQPPLKRTYSSGCIA